MVVTNVVGRIDNILRVVRSFRCIFGVVIVTWLIAVFVVRDVDVGRRICHGCLWSELSLRSQVIFVVVVIVVIVVIVGGPWCHIGFFGS